MTVTTAPPQGKAPVGDPAGKAGKKGKKEKKGGRKKLLVLLLVLLLVGGAAYWFVLKPKGGEEPPPEKGEVLKLEPIQVNLSEGHYLKIGIALQLTKTAHEADGSQALDATINLFSGRSLQEVTKSETRLKLKHELEKELGELYHQDVMEVYYTDFVAQ